MSGKDHLIKHGTILLVATILSGVFNYGYHIAMVRMLGPEDYGALFSLTALFMIVSLPANTIQTIISKYISSFMARGEHGKMSALLARVFLKMLKWLSVGLIVYILSSKMTAGYLNISTVLPVTIIGIVIYVGLLLPINYGALQGAQRFTELGVLQILGAFARVAFGIILVYFGLGVDGALFAALLSCSCVAFVGWWFTRDIWSFRPFAQDIGTKAIYKYFVPVSISYICYGVVTYIDAVIVKHYFSPLQAGYYSSVSVLGKSFLFAPMAFSGALFPKVSSRHEQGDTTRHLLTKTLAYSGLVCGAGVLICFVFAREIISLVIKRADLTEQALNTMVPLLRYMGIAITPYGLACIVINYHLAKHWTKFLPYLVASTFLQIILLKIFHETFTQVLTVLFIAGILILLCGVPAAIMEKLKVKSQRAYR